MYAIRSYYDENWKKHLAAAAVNVFAYNPSNNIAIQESNHDALPFSAVVTFRIRLAGGRHGRRAAATPVEGECLVLELPRKTDSAVGRQRR